jgi:putative transposase
VVHAVGVNHDGYRESLGLEIVTSEDGAAWLGFLRNLVARGLTGVQLVTSDAHPGLVDALHATLSGAAWQRCRTRFMRNLLTRVPKTAQPAVATLVRSIYAQPDADQVREQYARVVAQLDERFPAAAELMADAEADLFAFTALPKSVWRQVLSHNPIERLDKEIRRRTDVVGIFLRVLLLPDAVARPRREPWVTRNLPVERSVL